jgi:ribosomal protein L7/L12
MRHLIGNKDILCVCNWAMSIGISDREVRDAVRRMLMRSTDPEFAHRYIDFGEYKIRVIKAYRTATGVGLKESKNWVETGPHKVNLSLAKALQDEGAVVELASGYS